MARSFVFMERTAGVPNACCRVTYPHTPKSTRARTESFPALGLFASPILIRLTSTPAPRQRFEWPQPGYACDRSERPEGAHCSTSTGSSDRLLQPTFSIFKDENLRLVRLPDHCEGQALRSPMNLSGTRRVGSHRTGLAFVVSLCSVLCHTRPARPSPMTPRHLLQRSGIPGDPPR
jgi:hypothetical protein